MKAWWLMVLLGALPAGARTASATAPATRLPRTNDSYFVEDDGAYSRFLWFEAKGSYRQFHRDLAGSVEVDRGAWDQPPGGEVALHPTNGMLAYRALSSGPLLIELATQEQIDLLPALRRRMTAFLKTYQDTIFAGSAVSELSSASELGTKDQKRDAACVLLPGPSDSFSRSDLESLLGQVDGWLQSRTSGVFIFDAVAQTGEPLLLVQHDAVFSVAELAGVRAANPLKRNEAPPLYFARVSRQVFFKRLGSWKPFENLAGLHAQPPVSLKAP